MREIAKVFVIGALGLVMLFGSSAVSSAAQPKIQRFSECQCTCSYTDAQGRAQQGRFNFFPQPNNTTCAYQAIGYLCPVLRQCWAITPGHQFWQLQVHSRDGTRISWHEAAGEAV